MKPSEGCVFFDNCTHRHWCALSEPFTGADSLLTALERGWRITDYSFDRTHACLTQRVLIYVFELRAGDERVYMRVIANPYVERFIKQFNEHLRSRAARPRRAMRTLFD